tara:strand:+ start:1241 stop:3163 length:1923 start_codon:yes stop_codon:yes gene_type:complete
MATTFPDTLVQDRAKKVVHEAFQKSENFQDAYFSKYKKWYGLYRGYQQNKSYHGRADLFVPEAFGHIEAIHARVIRAFQGVKAKPQSSDDVEKSKAAERLLEYQTRVFNYKQAFKDLDKSAKIYGHGILKASWVFGKGGSKDHPIIESVDPSDYFWDPNATNRANGRYEIHRTYSTMTDIENNPHFDEEAIEKLKRNKESGGGQAGDEEVQDYRRAIQGLSNPSQKGKIQLVEYWGMFSEDDDEEKKEYLIVLANDEVVLRLEENPFTEIFKDGIVDENYLRPFVVMKDTDVPHEFHGMGMIEPIEKLLEELNDTRNQRMDNVTDVIDHMWQVVDGADIDEGELVRRPGGIVHTAIANGVSPLPVNDVTQSAYNEEQIIKEDIQRALGVPDVAVGSLQNLQGEAAATILALQESANVRFDVKIGAFADAIRHAYSLILAYNQRWMDKKVIVRLEGRDVEGDGEFDFAEIDKEAIAGKFDIDVQMDTQSNKIVRRQEAFQLYQLLAQTPMVNQEFNLRTLLESVDRKDIEQLLDVPPPQPPQPEEPKKSISVSLKGDLNALESDDIAVIMGANPDSADPLMRPELRELMQPGSDGKGSEETLKEMELQEKVAEEQRLNRQLDLKERELDIKESEIGSRSKE